LESFIFRLRFIQTSRHATCIWGALLLRHFREQGFFLTAADDVPQEALTYIAKQMGAKVPAHSSFDLASDTARRHRQYILVHLGFHRATDRERRTLQEWLGDLMRDIVNRVCTFHFCADDPRLQAEIEQGMEVAGTWDEPENDPRMTRRKARGI